MDKKIEYKPIVMSEHDKDLMLFDRFDSVRHLEGREVKIIGKSHPWFGELGRIKKFDVIGGRAGCIVELIEQAGHECTVYDGKELKYI